MNPNTIRQAAIKVWADSWSEQGFEDWLECQKQAGLFWGA